MKQEGEREDGSAAANASESTPVGSLKRRRSELGGQALMSEGTTAITTEALHGRDVGLDLDALVDWPVVRIWLLWVNPVEYIWGYLKHTPCRTSVLVTSTISSIAAGRHLRSMQRRAILITAFCQQAELF